MGIQIGKRHNLSIGGSAGQWSSYWTKLIGAAALLFQNNDAFITEDGEYLILE